MDKRSSGSRKRGATPDTKPSPGGSQKRKAIKSKKLKVSEMTDFQQTMLKERNNAFGKLNKEFQDEMLKTTLVKDAADVGHDPRHPEFAKIETSIGAYQMTARDIYRQFGGDGVGDICTFGLNDFDQLGFENEGKSSFLPTRISALERRRIRMVDCGGMHSVALSDAGVPWTWGAADDGALGREVEDDMDGVVPKAVGGFVANGKDESKTISQVSAGDAYTLFLSLDGNVYSTGMYKENDSKKFKIIARPGESPLGSNATPQHISQMPGKVKFIASGGEYGAAILRDHTMVTWGMGQQGELARSKDMSAPRDGKGEYNLRSWYKKQDGSIDAKIILEEFLKPQPPRFNFGSPKKTIVTIGCGLYHMLVVAREPGTASTNVYSSGANNYGQLGLGDTKNRHELTVIRKLEGKEIAQVQGGEHFSMALDILGKELYTFGRSDNGQLGVVDKKDQGVGSFQHFPVLVKFPAKEPVLIKKIMAGDRHAFAISAEDDLWSWGFEAVAGHKGYDNKETKQPKLLDLPQYLKRRTVKVYHVAGGGQHSVAVYEAWGEAEKKGAGDDDSAATTLTN